MEAVRHQRRPGRRVDTTTRSTMGASEFEPNRGGEGRRPLIGVSTGFTDYGDYLGFAFSRPLLAAGALPLLLPYVELAAERRRLLDHLDGLLLGFGRDL